jgi:hypothetical protein
MASCNLTTGFPEDCFNAAGGITTVYVAPFSQKGNLQIVSGSVANTGSILVSGSGAQFFTYNVRRATSQAKETTHVSRTNGTVYFAPEVDFVLTRTDAQKRNELQLLANQSVMVIVHDHTFITGSYWLYGSDSGLEISGDQSTGKAYGDLNGFSLKFGPGMETYPFVQVPSSSMNAQITAA